MHPENFQIMYKYSKIIFTLVFTLLLTPLVFGQKKIDYVKGGIPEARSMAVKEGKLFFAVFYTDWCLPCKWMDDNSFAAKEVVDFVEDHYRAVRINIDEFDGHATRQQYNVEFLPTIIIFDQGGGILAKFEESLSAKRLMEALEKTRFDMESKSIRLSAVPPAAVKLADVNQAKPQAPPASTTPPVEKPKTETPIQPVATPSSAAPVVEEQKKVETKPEVKATTQPKEEAPTKIMEEKAQPKQSPPATTPKAATTPAPALDSGTYYSVQVGTFNRFENADKMRNEYRGIFGEGVHIKIEPSGAETIYKVMIGRYQTYEAAEPLVKLLKEQGMDGFIKSVKQ